MNKKNQLNQKLIEMGRAFRPHGIRGGFGLLLENEEGGVLQKGVRVFLFPLDLKSSLCDQGQEFVIESISFGNKIICYFEGINDRNQAEEMLPFKIMFPEADFPELSDDEYYLKDLIGLKVLDHLTGRELGEIVDFYDNCAQIVVEMNLIHPMNQMELPFIEEFFPEIHWDLRTVSLKVPEVVEVSVFAGRKRSR